jgi:anti-sigma factor RsiW
MDSLEEYLSGTLKPADRQAIDAHLNICQACREEIRGMQDVSQLFVSLKSEEIWEPSPGFYAGVMRQVEEETAAPSFAGVFALDFAFARRLVFASLLILAVLGSYLVSRETEYPAGPSPEAILAQEDAPAFSSAPAQDNMLVTLTAYEQR